MNMAFSPDQFLPCFRNSKMKKLGFYSFSFWLNIFGFLKKISSPSIFTCSFMRLLHYIHLFKPHFYVYVFYLLIVLRKVVLLFYLEGSDILETTSKLRIHVPLSHSHRYPPHLLTPFPVHCLASGELKMWEKFESRFTSWRCQLFSEPIRKGIL